MLHSSLRTSCLLSIRPRNQCKLRCLFLVFLRFKSFQMILKITRVDDDNIRKIGVLYSYSFFQSNIIQGVPAVSRGTLKHVLWTKLLWCCKHPKRTIYYTPYRDSRWWLLQFAYIYSYSSCNQRSPQGILLTYYVRKVLFCKISHLNKRNH